MQIIDASNTINPLRVQLAVTVGSCWNTLLRMAGRRTSFALDAYTARVMEESIRKTTSPQTADTILRSISRQLAYPEPIRKAAAGFSIDTSALERLAPSRSGAMQ